MKDNDIFHGDNEKLSASIEALLALDAKGALVPHGIGEHARTLLSTAVQRLSESDGRADALDIALRKIKARLDAYAEADMRMPEPSVEVCQAIAGAALKMAQGGDEYRKSCEAAHKSLSMENQRIVAPGQFKCLACGDVHPGSGNLPCPKMSPTA